MNTNRRKLNSLAREWESLLAITIFTFGYYGWGNHTPQLVKSVDAVEFLLTREAWLGVRNRLLPLARLAETQIREWERNQVDRAQPWEPISNSLVGSEGARVIKVNARFLLQTID